MATMTDGEIRSLVDQQLAEIIEIRRDLHAHPELSNQEHRTAGVVRRELDAMGIAYRSGVGAPDASDEGTGVVAHLPATVDSPGPCTALRADMDALPIGETTSCSYASTVPGVMHACGHDGHTSILLGAARVLSAIERPNPVTLVFQPAEEDGGGGEKLCRDGALLGDDGGPAGIGVPVERIFALHGWPGMPLGTLGTRPGPLLASTDDFVVTVRGRGGHAAMPHLCKDPVLAGSAVVQALQSMTSRGVSPLRPVVCTVARFEGGTVNNVIPETVELEGTIRALDEETRTLAREQFFSIVESTARAHGCVAEIDYQPGYPVTRNDDALASHWFGVMRPAFGEQARLVPEPFMGGEDFSYYGKKVPGCFFLLGVCPEGEADTAKLHESHFDFNDDALPIGIEAMVRLAISPKA